MIKTAPIQAVIPADTKKRFKDEAKKRGLSLTWVLTQIMDRWVSEQRGKPV